MDVQKITLFAMIAAILSLFLRQAKSDWGGWISLMAGMMIVIYILSQMSGVKELGGQFQNMLGKDGDTYIRLIWKALGITYLCEISSDICKETGNLLIARQVEICGKLSVLLMGIPVILALYQMLIKVG